MPGLGTAIITSARSVGFRHLYGICWVLVVVAYDRRCHDYGHLVLFAIIAIITISTSSSSSSSSSFSIPAFCMQRHCRFTPLVFGNLWFQWGGLWQDPQLGWWTIRQRQLLQVTPDTTGCSHWYTSICKMWVDSSWVHWELINEFTGPPLRNGTRHLLLAI